MTARAPSLPPRLEALVRGVEPVRPLAPSWLRALAVALAVLPLLALAWQSFGFRSDWAALGGFGATGLSLLQALAGVALVAAGLAEAVPGRQHGRGPLVALTAGGALLMLGVTLASAALSPTRSPPGLESHYFKVCLAVPLQLGVLPLLIAAALAARAWPMRPALAGLLYGLGCGLVVDSGWRLLCEVGDAGHVLGAHGLALVSLAVLGAGVGSLTGRLTSRRA